VWISANDQADLLRSSPSLPLLLARKSLMNFVVRFPIKQPGHFVPVSESFEMMELVPEDTAVKVNADADVQGQ
jgi:hypothetical protein